MNQRSFLFAAALALAAVPFAHAQIDSGNCVAYDWGAAHVTSGQAVVLNFAVNTLGTAIALTAQFELADKNGNVFYRNVTTVNSGHAVSLAISPDLRPAVPADIYAVIAPDIRIVQVRLKIAWPPGPTVPSPDRMSSTLELMDTVSGRVVAFAGNPHAIIGVL